MSDRPVLLGPLAPAPLKYCGSDATSCGTSSATYVPPGWSCSGYFVTGLGYSGTVCANAIAPPTKLLNAIFHYQI